MAVDVVPMDSSMQLVYNIGEDDEGRTLTRRRTFTNIKVDANEEDLFDIAVAFEELQEHYLADVIVIDKKALQPQV